jgi:hypothetical protein
MMVPTKVTTFFLAVGSRVFDAEVEDDFYVG